MAKTVLVTGCSSGIGHATAARFDDAGWTTYATVRDPNDVASLASAPILAVPFVVLGVLSGRRIGKLGLVVIGYSVRVTFNGVDSSRLNCGIILSGVQ